MSRVKAAATRSLRTLGPQPADATTRYLLDKHCVGRGIEVGPGAAPYGARYGAILVDRFDTDQGRQITLDLKGDAKRLR